MNKLMLNLALLAFHLKNGIPVSVIPVSEKKISSENLVYYRKKVSTVFMISSEAM